MKLRNIFKTTICLCIALIMLICMTPAWFSSISLAENTFTESIQQLSASLEVVPYGTGSANMNYPTTSISVITGYVDQVKYAGYFGTGGSDGVVVLRFTNNSTGDFKDFTFICDSSWYTRNLNFQLTPGIYRITEVANTVGNFTYLFANFY